MVTSAELKLGIQPWVIFVLAIFLYPGLSPVSSFGLGILNMTRLMAVYFTFGVVIGSDRNIRMFSAVPIALLPVLVAAGLMVSSLAGWSGLPYRHTFLPTSTFAFAGIIAVVAAALLLDKARLGSAIRFLGRHSLEIYLVHTIAMAGVRVALIKFAGISAPAPHLLLGTFAGLYIPIALVLFFERVDFQFAFTFPRSPRLGLTGHTNSSRP
jgi:peptidoglycan/LPS O-acetylase OafA/YrhL